MGLRNPAAATPQVALIVDSTFGYGRNTLEGIAQYVREYGPWSLYFEPRNLANEIPSWLRRWKGNGIIGGLQNPTIVDAVLRTGLPVVDTLGGISGGDVPMVQPDEVAIGQIAADHLLERGFRSFGCCAFCVDPGDRPADSPQRDSLGNITVGNWLWSGTREQSLVERVTALGCQCSVHRVSNRTVSGSAWEREQDQLAAWISRLPQPAGVFAVNDNLGQRVLEACRRADVAVPDRVAVVGVDNDELVCRLCAPPLSSVAAEHFQVGYEAARLLDQLMRGDPVPETSLKIPPRSVVTRMSSDVLAVNDLEIAQAVREIREHACEGIDVAEVARRVGLSRTTLKRRFQAALKRSVHEEIVAVQMKRARQLLAETELPLKIIARRAGFRHASSLAAAFKSRTGMTSREFRARKHP